MFENLLPPPFNAIVLDLLFELATWHGLAKLCVHTDSTLDYLDTSTTRLGRFLRRFSRETKKVYQTRDLPAEEAARGRRKAAMLLKSATKDATSSGKPMAKPDTGAAEGSTTNKGKQKAGGPKLRYLNLTTYKLHALGDYVDTIRRFGPTDNYTTQLVSSLSGIQHCRPV